MLEEENRRRLLKYRYILLAILAVIIILLIILFITIAAKNDKAKQERIIEQARQEELARIAAEEQARKEEEERAAKEAMEQKAREEEENATGIIYLTFDDGPTLDTTPKILDILAEKGIKATFFVLHYGEKNEEIIKREYDSGHTIGLHGYTHKYEEVYQSADVCIENFKKIQNQVLETTGYTSKIIRFPGGSSNTISRKYCEGVMTQVTQMALDQGFRYFDWNVDSCDSGSARTSEDVYQNVVSGLKEKRNNVVLMHDFNKNEKTVNALSGIIDYGFNNGYVFRNITEETPMVTHKTNN